MSDYVRRRRLANAIAAVALLVMLVLVGIALRFETRDERPGGQRTPTTVTPPEGLPKGPSQP